MRVVITGSTGLLGRSISKLLSSDEQFVLQKWSFSRSGLGTKKVDLTRADDVVASLNDFKVGLFLVGLLCISIHSIC